MIQSLPTQDSMILWTVALLWTHFFPMLDWHMKDFHKASFQWETFHNLKLCFRSDYSEMKVSMREPNFSTFDLRIRNGKRRNKKKISMAYWCHRNEHWLYLWQCKMKFRLLPLALENLTQCADSCKKKKKIQKTKKTQQSNKWEDTNSLLPLKDFNIILKQSATDEWAGYLHVCVPTEFIGWRKRTKKLLETHAFAFYLCEIPVFM